MERTDPIDRETAARRDLSGTQFAPRAAILLTCLFLAAIALPSASFLLSQALEWVVPARPPMPEIVEPAHIIVQSQRSAPGQTSAPGSWKQRLDQIEARLEQETRRLLPAEAARPWLARAGMGGPGVWFGRDGWLFYARDLEHAWGRPFLEPGSLRQRLVDQPDCQPDPLRAIDHFARQLHERGIALVVFPVPSKAAVHAERFAAPAGGLERAIENSSMPEFWNALRNLPLYFLNAAPSLKERAVNHRETLYLKRDSHWAPGGLELAAALLAQVVRSAASFEEPEVAPLQRALPVEALGDLALMAGLAETERVVIRQVDAAESAGPGAEREQGAEVLLLGDSFSNIYSLPEMGWGDSAGLAERLGASLGRRVDRIIQNDGGAAGTRQAFARALASTPGRFARLKVVVWQFAERELSFADWKLVALPASGMPRRQEEPPAAATEWVTIKAWVLAAGSLPEPGSVPYREAILGLEVEAAALPKAHDIPRRMVIYLWGMRENRKLAAAFLKTGQEVRLRILPWQRVEPKLGRLARVEPDDAAEVLLRLPAFWGELVE
jgi:alginate O-acetyltransferase complex protein AlgJ